MQSLLVCLLRNLALNYQFYDNNFMINFMIDILSIRRTFSFDRRTCIKQNRKFSFLF